MTAGTLPHRFSLPAAALRGLIDRTRFAISTEETRYYLNGIYLHVTEVRRHPGAARRRDRRAPPRPRRGAVAGRGRLDARRHRPAQDGRRAAQAAGRDDGRVEVALSETRIQFKLGTVQLTSKLIDGTFPEYERVIPRDNDKVLRVGKKDFSDAVARVAAISTERSRPVKLSLARDLLVLSAASPDQGTATEELDVGPRQIRGRPARDRLSGPLPQRHHRPDRRRGRVPLLRRRRAHDRAATRATRAPSTC